MEALRPVEDGDDFPRTRSRGVGGASGAMGGGGGTMGGAQGGEGGDDSEGGGLSSEAAAAAAVEAAFAEGPRDPLEGVYLGAFATELEAALAHDRSSSQPWTLITLTQT